MRRSAKIGILVGGYVAAVAAAIGAGWLHDLRMAAQPYDTSGGMYAGGQWLTSLGAFLAVALVPTLAGLWFVRSRPHLWNALAGAALAFAVVGLAAVLVPLASGGRTDGAAFAIAGLVALAQLLGAPLWTAAFALFAALAPTRASRRTLVLATGIELAIGVCAAIHWFVPGSPL